MKKRVKVAPTRGRTLVEVFAGEDARRGGPHLQWTTSTDAGSCSFCDRHVSSSGALPHAILKVGPSASGSGVVVRFCDRCREALVAFSAEGDPASAPPTAPRPGPADVLEDILDVLKDLSKTADGIANAMPYSR